MEVVTGAMGTLLPMLGDLLKEEYRLQKSTRGEIKFLKAELESMEAALIKISKAPLDQPPDVQVKLWARDVKDLSYEIEDSVDRFRVHLECREQKKPHSFMGFIHRSMDMLTKGKIRHKIGIDIKDIKIRIQEISERRDRYKVDCVASKPTGISTDSLRQLAFFQKASELIGTEKKSLDIVRMLMEGDEVLTKQLQMISMVGFGGLGKTTLANLVYEKLRVDFDCAAFVYVSLNPNMEKVFKSLLHQLDNNKYKNIMDESAWSEIQLISKIRDILQNKRYLILIDDIWDKSVWKNIRCALIENDCGSRVIATTRILDVAKEVGGVYQLKPLSTSDSRKLFHQRVFGNEDMYPPAQLAEVSENILRKCGGVPLAIITLAGVLAGKKGHENTYTYWSKVYQSMGSGLENNPGLKDMRRILYVSYYDLPPELKACLLYLSLYPEDYCIQAKALIWKWIGEGFVHEEQGKSLYEVGEAYFEELINKGLIQPMDINLDNRASSCRVHDMVLDLVTSLSSEDNFVTTLCGQQPTSVPSKVRRISLQTSKEEDFKQMPTISLSSVRSLTVFSTTLSLLSALPDFLVLRTLDLSGCAEVVNHHMKDICNLLHLRFLGLKGTSITDIPKDIGNLQLLQVLDIRSLDINKFPSTFVQLRELVLVDIGFMKSSTSTLLLRLMSYLPSISSLAIELGILRKEDLQVLGTMPSLRDLNIYVISESGEKRLVIDNGCPFRCLTRLRLAVGATDFMFTQGAMQMLQILELEFDVGETEYLFGDHHFGLETLASLEHVHVVARCVGHVRESNLSGPISKVFQKELDIHPNKPRLAVKLESKLALPLRYLKDITNNFSDEQIVGKGGFGVVYKGLLHNGAMVAVKKILQEMPGSGMEFENKVNILMMLKHPNIVQLKGCCYETRHLRMPYEGKSVFVWNTECFICFEYLRNGSLDKYISDASSGLNWHMRCKVIEGISYGLHYLHECFSESIIHLDLKPSNILLDDKMLPKLTDFGLSRLFGQNEIIYTAIDSGTLDYMPPEGVTSGIVTPMWDIFSLGVIILEVITGHKDYPYDIRKDSAAFIELELQKWRNRLQKEPGYTSLETNCHQIERCIRIGLICVNPERTKRPIMKKIINVLEGLETMDWYIVNELSSQDIKSEA